MALRCDACWPAPCRCPKEPVAPQAVGLDELARYILLEWPDTVVNGTAPHLVHEWPAVTASFTLTTDGQLILEADRTDNLISSERATLPCTVRDAVQAWKMVETRHDAWSFGRPTWHEDEAARDEARDEFSNVVANWVLGRKRVAPPEASVPEQVVGVCPVCSDRLVMQVRPDPDVGCELCWECEGCTLQWNEYGRPYDRVAP